MAAGRNLNTGLVAQVLRERGYGNPEDKDLLREVLAGVQENRQLGKQLHEAVHAAGLGLETETQASLLAAVQLCARASTVEAVRESGARLDLGGLVAALMEDDGLERVLKDAQGDRTQKLRDILGEQASGGGSEPEEVLELSEQAMHVDHGSEEVLGEDAQPAEPLPLQHRVFGLSGAATFELCKLPGGGGRSGGMHSVSLEMAQPVRGQSSGDGVGRKYVWAEKMVLVFTARELVRAAAGAAGMFDEPQEFKRPKGGKVCTLARQPGLLYLRMEEGSRRIGVQIVESDIFGVAMMFQEAMRLNWPGSDAATRLEMMKCMVGVIQSKTKDPKQGVRPQGR